MDHKQLSPRQHVIRRPNIYFGTSLHPKYSTYMNVCPDGHIRVQYGLRSPSLEKMIEEVLNNAADQKSRDPAVKCITIAFDRETGRITVGNDGNGIPVVKTHSHNGREMYVPELVMGNLRSGNNFDDNTQKRTTGGCNGVGVKLTNIYSTEFAVVSGYRDANNKRLLYSQKWEGRMSTCHPPSIKKNARVSDLGTTVSFVPCYNLFEVTPMLPSIEAYFKVRAHELCATINCHLSKGDKKVRIYYNDEEVKCDLHRYASAFCGGNDVVTVRAGDRWCVSIFERAVHEAMNDETVAWSNEFERCAKQIPYSMSFVNHIPTVYGGTHQSEVLKLFTARVAGNISSKKNVIKTEFVRKCIGTVVSAIIENPEFNHQGKSKLSMKPRSMGSMPIMVQTALKKVVSHVSRFARNVLERQELASMATTKKRKRFNPKYEPAQKKTRQNTLFLTEGDSAKTLVIAGRSFYNIQKSIGVYPLKGKVLNVRSASAKDILKNKEIQDFIQIMGFEINKKGEGIPPRREKLTYHTITIMTDQDTDGSHIKGLILNVLGYFWPSTLSWPGFVRVFHTPIIRCTTRSGGYREFFTIVQYRSWWDTVDDKGAWDVQYYKGLGTNTRKDAQNMFSNADKYLVAFDPVADHELDDIDMCFNNKRAGERKTLLADPSNEVCRPTNIREFARGELLDHFRADNLRSIPSLVDGLKPSQRKVLFACLKRRLAKKIVVEKLAGYVGEHAAYHHGQKSLEETIVGMASDFVGGLNLPLLVPASMMGTRLLGGRDHASSRYTKTYLQPYVTKLFPATTNINLEYLEEDGERIEPIYYFPVVCLVLVNGCHGIGTGYSTHIPMHDIRDIIRRQRAYLRKQEYQSIPIRPFVNGFKGTTTRANGRVIHTGTYTWLVQNKKAHVTELPPGKWTTPYITSHRDKERKVVNNGSDETIDIVVSAPHLSADDLDIVTTESLSNFVLFDSCGGIRKYKDINDIFDEYMRVGLDIYEKNVRTHRESLEHALNIICRKLTFIDAYHLLGERPILETADGDFPTIRPAMVAKGFHAPYHDLIDRDGRILVGLTDRAIERLMTRRSTLEAQIQAWSTMTAIKMWMSDIDQFEASM